VIVILDFSLGQKTAQARIKFDARLCFDQPGEGSKPFARFVR
jgi:hypothetical protein